MTFEDLPAGWEDRPLDDPAITADVLDLFVSYADRLSGAVAALLCTQDGRLVQPVVVHVPPQLTPADKGELLEGLTDLLRPARHPAPGSILFAVAREQGIFVDDGDREWHADLVGACRSSGVRSLGMWIVTAGAIRQMPMLPPMAAADVRSA